MKQTVRALVLSRAYQTSSAVSAAARSKDPENRLFSHTNRRRLDAEAIRDCLLSVSGQLDDAYGGTTIGDVKAESTHTFRGVRRSVYVPVMRNTLHPLFEVFDVADPNMVSGRRNVSTLPTQALFMMNSPLVQDQSQLAAERILAMPDLDDAGRLTWLYQAALGRNPSQVERRLALGYIEEFTKADNAQTTQAWAHVCQSVFSSLDFRFVD